MTKIPDYLRTQLFKTRLVPSAMARAYNSSTLGSQDRKITWTQKLENNLGNLMNPDSINFSFIFFLF